MSNTVHSDAGVLHSTWTGASPSVAEPVRSLLSPVAIVAVISLGVAAGSDLALRGRATITNVTMS